MVRINTSVYIYINIIGQIKKSMTGGGKANHICRKDLDEYGGMFSLPGFDNLNSCFRFSYKA